MAREPFSIFAPESSYRQNDTERGTTCLAQALMLSRDMDGATWQMAGPKAVAELYNRALTAGLDVEHVQQQIRRLGLEPPAHATVSDAWPWPLRVYTLGRFEIYCNGALLRSSGKTQRKPLELLKCLCAMGGLGVSVERVTDALWPDTDGDAADQALRTTLHRLRKLLQHESVVRLEDRQLHLDPSCLWADNLAFDGAAQRFAMADASALRDTLERYRGPFLDGESAPWASACRDRLQTQFLRVAERLGALLEGEGDWTGATHCYQRVIDIDPVAESFHRRLMTAYASLGRRSEALAVYERCRRSLLSRHGVSPSRETQAHYRLLADR